MSISSNPVRTTRRAVSVEDAELNGKSVSRRRICVVSPRSIIDFFGTAPTRRPLRIDRGRLAMSSPVNSALLLQVDPAGNSVTSNYGADERIASAGATSLKTGRNRSPRRAK